MVKRIFLVISFIFYNLNDFGFGFYTHEKINYYTVFAFQENELFKFYKKNIRYFTKHAADPDKRKFKIKDEGMKHFFNIDAKEYNKDILNSKWITYENMCEKYGEKIVKKYGILPWAILATQKALTKAFQDKNKKLILLLSINLAHYIADAHTPLHVTRNYDGQETNQMGIHALWETQLPKMFFQTYNIIGGQCKYVTKTYEIIWDTLLNSHKLSKIILEKEKKLNNLVIIGKYSYTKNGKMVNRMHSKKYATRFHKMLEGQVEQQIQKAVNLIASIIYTCWVNAGRPELT